MLFAWTVVLSWLLTSSGVLISVVLQNTRIPLDYGRHRRAGSKSTRTVGAGTAWRLATSPSLVMLAVLLLAEQHDDDAFRPRFGHFLTALFALHCTYRALLYPLLCRSPRGIPTRLVVVATCFSTLTAFCQIVWNGRFQPEYADFHPKLLVHFGVFLFFTGFGIHVFADCQLAYLRYSNPHHHDYRIPVGALFAFVSCPNYFGECLEWIGYALAARSFPAIAHAFFTVCLLAPRAQSHHEWYRKTFGDEYPARRRALVPFLW